MHSENSKQNGNDSFIAEQRQSLVQRASALRIAAGELAEGMKTGNFRSMHISHGIEFSGVRDYIPGDDIRSIDWNVTARMGHPYVKLFEEERELQIFIVLDKSLSMQIGSGRSTKYQAAAETAALITLAAEKNACPVGAVFFDGTITFSCIPENSRNRTMLILTELDSTASQSTPGSVMSNALNGAGKILKKKSMVFVISDFRISGWEKSLAMLAHKHDVIAVRICDDMDSNLVDTGLLNFSDCESDYTVAVPAGSRSFRKSWKKAEEYRVQRWEEYCVRHGIFSQCLNTNDDPLKMLLKIFGRKEAVL